MAADKDETLSNSKRQREKARCEGLIDKLRAERAAQEEHIRHVQACLEARNSSFVPDGVQKSDLITQFLQVRRSKEKQIQTSFQARG